MASTLARNIPMMIMTAAIVVSMYILWRHVTRLEERVELLNLHSASRLDQLTNELYYSINGVDDNNKTAMGKTQPYVIEQSLQSFENDQASSVPSEDVITEERAKDAHSANDFGEKDDRDVNAYIGNLQDKFVANNEDDTESIVSGATLSGGRKKSPPQLAASFPVGHQQMHNGKLFEVIKTKTNVIRWGKPTAPRQDVDQEAD